MNRNNSNGYRGMGMEGIIASWYAKNTEKDIEEYRKLGKKVSAQVEKGAKILEIAPGPGFLAIELAKLGDFVITGLDISPSFVAIAKQKARDAGVEIDFRQGDAADMPFADERFDFIVCRAAFKNFSEPVKALREMYRVLIPGGHALIEDLRRNASKEAVDHYVDSMGLTWINAWMTKMTFRHMLIKRAYIKDEIESYVSQLNFSAFEIQENPLGLDIFLTR